MDYIQYPNSNNRIKCKCKYCEDRHINCHSTCKHYQEYKNTISEAKAYLNIGKEANIYAYERSKRIKQSIKKCLKLQHKQYSD